MLHQPDSPTETQLTPTEQYPASLKRQSLRKASDKVTKDLTTRIESTQKVVEVTQGHLDNLKNKVAPTNLALYLDYLELEVMRYLTHMEEVVVEWFSKNSHKLAIDFKVITREVCKVLQKINYSDLTDTDIWPGERQANRSQSRTLSGGNRRTSSGAMDKEECEMAYDNLILMESRWRKSQEAVAYIRNAMERAKDSLKGKLFHLRRDFEESKDGVVKQLQVDWYAEVSGIPKFQIG